MKRILKSSAGQVTIFFATTIIIMITLMAFIINIGVFVKAKINLQNATDAAAYAGASVQARQLTNIAYLNWEMRNIYKEWMFKYYVLGGINLSGVVNTSGTSMNFTMDSYQTGTRPAFDSFNFPSACIDFASTGSVGLCTKYMIPGLPRFKSSQVLGMSETTNAFIDAIVAQKNNDCTERSQINFYTVNTWAYNVTDLDSGSVNNMRDLAPEIAAGRLGAFPQAFEVALRIRNLEAQVNKPAYSGVCDSSGNHPNCSVKIGDLIGSDPTPSNERIYKAFYSGFRNLGSQNDVEMRKSFTLTEIAPAEWVPGDAFSTSTLLIPSNSPGQYKRYLDLKLMTVNYATFYTAFTQGGGDYTTQGMQVDAEGQCTATKTGLPVPGYPLGFVKNPDVLTYYAVKGEAQFVGLFNPFTNIPINLTAFAAAKPFGGRIGPMLFSTKDSRTITPRGGGTRRSSPYISALDTVNFRNQYGDPLNYAGGNPFEPGVPLPLNFDTSNPFWLTDANSNVGGYAGSGQSVTFGVPNIAYDYPNDIYSRDLYTSNLDIQIISDVGPSATAGLFNPDVFNKFKSKLRGIGGVVDIEAIEDGLRMIRAPTLLEANNYLIPTPEVVNSDQKTDSFGVIYSDPVKRDVPDNEGNTYDFYNHEIYAPVFADTSDSIFKTEEDIRGVLDNYLSAQQQAIEKYIHSMGIAAQKIYNWNKSNNTDQNLGIEAAKGISDIPVPDLESDDPERARTARPTCNSIAGQFAYFYLDTQSGVVTTPGCPTPLRELMIKRWNQFGFANNYNIEYALPKNSGLQKQLFSAYRPGVEHDADEEGTQKNPLSNSSDVMIRNFYSTKFIQLAAVTTGKSETYGGGGGGFPIISEGRVSKDGDEGQKEFKNPIDPDSVNLDLTKIRH